MKILLIDGGGVAWFWRWYDFWGLFDAFCCFTPGLIVPAKAIRLDRLKL
jgi:hypothetical protein